MYLSKFKPIVLTLASLLLAGSIYGAPANIGNRESGPSVRAKLNLGFSILGTLESDMVTALAGIGSDGTAITQLQADASTASAAIIVNGNGITAANILIASNTVAIGLKLDATATAVDSDLLDGIDSTGFATSTQGTTADSALQPVTTIAGVINLKSTGGTIILNSDAPTTGAGLYVMTGTTTPFKAIRNEVNITVPLILSVDPVTATQVGNLGFNDAKYIGKFPVFAPFDMCIGYYESVDYIDILGAGTSAFDGRYEYTTSLTTGSGAGYEHDVDDTYYFQYTGGAWVFKNHAATYTYTAPSGADDRELIPISGYTAGGSAVGDINIILHKQILNRYAKDIELKASINNFGGRATLGDETDMIYWFDSRGTVTIPEWSGHEDQDMSCNLYYTKPSGEGLGEDPRYVFNKTSLSSSLAGELGSAYSSFVSIYPSLVTAGITDISSSINPDNIHNVTWSYALIDPITGMNKTDTTGEDVWITTHVVRWTTTQH